MGKKQTERRRATLKKETVRKLDQAALTPRDLQQVVGGYVLGYKCTYPCATQI